MRNLNPTNRLKAKVDSIRSKSKYLTILLTCFLFLSTITYHSPVGTRDAKSRHMLSLPLYPMLNSAGNVSTYADENHVVASTTFAAGGTVYASGGGWPTRVNLTVNFTGGNVGEISVPLLVSSNIVETDAIGSFASSLKLAANGPPGVWVVYAELSPSVNSSSRFVVYIPAHALPSFFIPGLVIALGVGGLVGYLLLRRRANQASYYAAKSRGQGS